MIWLDTVFSLNPPGGWGSVHKEVETLWSTPARDFFPENPGGIEIYNSRGTQSFIRTRKVVFSRGRWKNGEAGSDDHKLSLRSEELLCEGQPHGQKRAGKYPAGYWPRHFPSASVVVFFDPGGIFSSPG